mmetsp:Transcript_91123/g.133173  ORF Transcript_91123/g.133173 Transcript_91123/m.133173 type:complete len:93 (+) Transcript_91123:117-395(+)
MVSFATACCLCLGKMMIYIYIHTHIHIHTRKRYVNLSRACVRSLSMIFSLSLYLPLSVCDSHHHGEHFLSAIHIIMENNDKSYINGDNSYIN